MRISSESFSSVREALENRRHGQECFAHEIPMRRRAALKFGNRVRVFSSIGSQLLSSAGRPPSRSAALERENQGINRDGFRKSHAEDAER